MKNPTPLLALCAITAGTFALMATNHAEARSATPPADIRFSGPASMTPKSLPISRVVATQEIPEQRELSLMAGESYDFEALVGSSTSGTWSASFGRCTPTGLYTAPSFIPPGSDETISYVNTQGVFISLEVHIRPNPSRPEANFPRYLRETQEKVRIEGVDYPLYHLIGGASQSVLQFGSLRDLLPADGTSIPILDNSEEYLPPRMAIDCVDLVSASSSPLSSEVPAEALESSIDASVTVAPIGSNTTLTIAGVPTTVDRKPKSCKVGPKSPWPSNQPRTCTEEGREFRVHSPTKLFSNRILPPFPGTIKVGAAIKNQVFEGLGIELQLNIEYSFIRTLVSHSKIHTDDVYTCINGRFEFVRREICEQIGQGEFTEPVWIAFIDGANMDGTPKHWSNWMCR